MDRTLTLAELLKEIRQPRKVFVFCRFTNDYRFFVEIKKNDLIKVIQEKFKPQVSTEFTIETWKDETGLYIGFV